jgi:hypothetical protein
LHVCAACDAYDSNIGQYIQFPQTEARKKGLTLRTDEQELKSTHSISALDHDAKTTTHDWLHQQPDLWNWIPDCLKR